MATPPSEWKIHWGVGGNIKSVRGVKSYGTCTDQKVISELGIWFLEDWDDCIFNRNSIIFAFEGFELESGYHKKLFNVLESSLRLETRLHSVENGGCISELIICLDIDMIMSHWLENLSSFQPFSFTKFTTNKINNL